MRILYPFNPLNVSEADEPYQEEFALLKRKGINCSLFDYDALAFDEFKPRPGLQNDEVVLYRGWMLTPENYRKLTRFITAKGASVLTSPKSYVLCHHLPNWYESCREFTALSRFFADDEHLIENVKALNWNRFFVKDFVKSNSTERGSIASTHDEVKEIVEQIRTFRGDIEGGVAIRQVEQYVEDSEKRYFVFNAKPYAPDGDVPAIVHHIATRINAPFFSVDIVQRVDGELRLVEIGDGQVSDKKMWNTEAFVNMVMENSEHSA